tara:strand:- start:206 stop:400 length:195 start_codon:yes stop_codon:yes gene_type:complete
MTNTHKPSRKSSFLNPTSNLQTIFNFFISNNQQIKERKLELQRILSGGESDVEKEFSFREKESL